MEHLITKYYKDLFLSNRLFTGLAGVVLMFLMSFFFPWLGDVPLLLFLVFVLLVVIDMVLLFRIHHDGVFARRNAPNRLSNGDDNVLTINLENFYGFKVQLGIIDEIPVQFQKRDIWFEVSMKPHENKIIDYKLKPVKRGEYKFGSLHVYVSSPLGTIQRRYTFEQEQTLPVYPSFLQMRKFELMAVSNRLSEVGVKKIRRLGHSMEFEQVKNYVAGDDYRTINWKATARRGDMMVNSYSDEKSQHVYCLIDKSRAMKMPFGGLSLLDYAINASLVLSNIAIRKEDKAGLITFGEKIGSILPADRRPVQLNKIQEVLYKEKTRYLESNQEALFIAIRNTLKQRSLLVLFTNFESLSALERQLPFLKRISRFHLLLVVFFENTELKSLAEEPARDLEGVYIKTIAEKFAYEKKQIVLELAKHGIQSILTAPQNLTINTINRYLEIKSRQSI
ncbi:DUF58 domain-containing protein [Desertivirga xinjiangensis]|uniref:DUF58 domain-containing protein n=1 Tax=Desertivirga xinjiangensis TaxID=539206 RepID=UPI0021087388|nr:DUF58 domain-containing protein [Pedobacter xinjiangensis]